MRKTGFVLILFLLSITTCFAQETSPKDILHLKNGDVFTGKIVLKTEQIVILSTDDGKRYQFQLSEIDKMEQEKPKVKKPADAERNFAGIVELNGGISHASAASIQTSPYLSANLALGSRNAFNTNTFAGLGIGLEAIISKEETKAMSFLPVFVQIHKSLTNKPINPFVGIKAGYAFSLNEELTGGTFFNLSGGVNFRLNKMQAINVGLFTKIQSISGTIIERNELGVFTTQGTVPAVSFGLNVGYLF